MTNVLPVVAVNDAMMPVTLIPQGSVSIVLAEEDNNRIRLPIGCVKVLAPGGAVGWVPASAFAEVPTSTGATGDHGDAQEG